MREAFHRAPLKIAKSFAHPCGGLDICVMDCSPGLLGGDRYELSWHLESGARAHVFTQGFTRVHPARPTPQASTSSSTCGSVLEQNIRLESGASLVLRPEPTVLFAGARLRSRTRVQMAAGSACVLCEVLCAGRVERGESFAFNSWRSVLEVERAGEMVFLSRQKCEPGEGGDNAAAAWGRHTHWGQVLAVCDELDGPRRDALLHEWRDILGASACWGGASFTARCGIAATFLGRNAWEAHALARRLADAFEAWRAGA